MRNKPRETRPTRVPRDAGTKQFGEVRARRPWTEPVVWTDRMLTALERGINGGVWFDTIPHHPLMERIIHKIADGRVLKLLEAFLTQRVMDGMEAACVRIRQTVIR